MPSLLIHSRAFTGVVPSSRTRILPHHHHGRPMHHCRPVRASEHPTTTVTTTPTVDTGVSQPSPPLTPAQPSTPPQPSTPLHLKATPWLVLAGSVLSPLLLCQYQLHILLQALWTSTTLLFIGYASSWLVGSTNGLIQRCGQTFNSARKSWSTALQLSHVTLLAVSATLAVTMYQNPTITPLPSAVTQALEWVSTVWPLVFVTCVNVILLGAVEAKRLTSKARVLALDAEGPGRAHPIMVQGAQSSARLCVWCCLLATNLALVWLDLCRGPAGGLAASLVVLQAAQLSVVEEAETEITRARPAVVPPSGGGPPTL